MRVHVNCHGLNGLGLGSLGLSGLGLLAAMRLPIPQSWQQTLGQVTGTLSTAAAKKPGVSSEALQADIDVDVLLARAKKLSAIADLSIDEYHNPTRVIGSKGESAGAFAALLTRCQGHAATLEYIKSELAELGDYYTVTNQSFPAVTGNVFASRLVLGNVVPTSARPMGLTPPTRGREPVYGHVALVDGNGCAASDYPAAVAGGVVLIQRGTCPFGEKSRLAGLAGAVAAVVYDNEPGDGVAGTLGLPVHEHVATFGMSGEEATPFVAQLRAGETLDAIAYIDSVAEQIETFNLLAQTTAGDADNCVMLGGHSGSVEAGPGINDDGSGTLSLLEIAVQLSKYDVRNCVRFAWWAGEEQGLLGSNWYASHLTTAENARIRLFMDYDMLASPNYIYQVYNGSDAVNPAGSSAVRRLYQAWYEEQGLPWELKAFDGRSDYVGFITHGIPGGGVATGAEEVKSEEQQARFGGRAGEWLDPCYHQRCDVVEGLELNAWEVNTRVSLSLSLICCSFAFCLLFCLLFCLFVRMLTAQLVAHSVATYADSLEDFPAREPWLGEPDVAMTVAMPRTEDQSV
jgi:aminopeptidase Y